MWVIFDKNRMEKSESENNTELGDKKSYAGIPEAEFVVSALRTLISRDSKITGT